MQYLEETQAFIAELEQQGQDDNAQQQVLSHLLELAVVMYRKGDIKTINQGHKMELVCQVKKGSRRLTLAKQ